MRSTADLLEKQERKKKAREQDEAAAKLYELHFGKPSWSSRLGRLFTIIGVVLVLGACGLFAYNMFIDAQAGDSAPKLLKRVENQMPYGRENFGAARTPATDMHGVEVNGNSYIGTLQLPTLDLELPVLSYWDDYISSIAPCRYAGSVYDNSLIIAGHNYMAHFGRLVNLSDGDAVTFTDVNGRMFSYKVSTIETIDGQDVEAMLAGEWDLTLFTCTFSGLQRTTVRCKAQTDSKVPAPE